MSVAELIAALQTFPGEMEVRFSEVTRFGQDPGGWFGLNHVKVVDIGRAYGQFVGLS